MEERPINPPSFYERDPDGTMCEKCDNYFPEEETIVAFLSKNNAWTLCHPCYDRWLDGEITENFKP